MTDTDDVRWEKGKILVAQSKEKTGKHFQQTEAFKIIKNGALQIKTLRREDNGVYDVMVYGADGSSKLQKAFDLRVLGESSLSEVSRFRVICSKLGSSVLVTLPSSISVSHSKDSSGWGGPRVYWLHSLFGVAVGLCKDSQVKAGIHQKEQRLAEEKGGHPRWLMEE